jgi:hypothetical protein
VHVVGHFRRSVGSRQSRREAAFIWYHDSTEDIEPVLIESIIRNATWTGLIATTGRETIGTVLFRSIDRGHVVLCVVLALDRLADRRRTSCVPPCALEGRRQSFLMIAASRQYRQAEYTVSHCKQTQHQSTATYDRKRNRWL